MNPLKAAAKRLQRRNRGKVLHQGSIPPPILPINAEAEIIYHYGMNSKSGDILKSAGGGAEPIVVEICSNEDRLLRVDRIARCLGEKYRSIPGHRPPDGIAGVLEDDARVPFHAAEMVYNDAALIDSLTIPGKYESLCSPTERAILELARTLYPEPKSAVIC